MFNKKERTKEAAYAPKPRSNGGYAKSNGGYEDAYEGGYGNTAPARNLASPAVTLDLLQLSHSVQNGDTLSAIAEKHAVTVDELCQFNSIEVLNTEKGLINYHGKECEFGPGMYLKIPTRNESKSNAPDRNIEKDSAQLQRKEGAVAANQQALATKKENNTGLPDQVKAGVENLSGMSLDDVKVHYNSVKPAKMNAHAYTQGTDIHVASGQEKHVAHEAWHVVQQAQGRVQPTTQFYGEVVNDNPSLENDQGIGLGMVQRKPTLVADIKYKDPEYPEMTLTLDEKLTEEYGENVYHATGVVNEATVTWESKYYNIQDNKKWIPQFAGGISTDSLDSELDKIAKENHGINCHIVAGQMQDAFKTHGQFSEVYEIYTGDPEKENHIMVMKARVRNHYVNILDEKVYDSGTGAMGISLNTYMENLQSENDGLVLKIRKAPISL